MKRIVLCADDFGQALHISSGILELVKQGRLSAVSCMVNSPDWPDHAARLLPFREQIDIGLHLNLTEGKPLALAFQKAHGNSFSALPKLLQKAFLGRLDRQALVAEFHAQIDKFAAEMGFLPQFIDGHQHVHQFPGVREALIEVYQARLRGHAYVRLVNVQRNLELKRWIIYLTGTAALQRLLHLHKIPHNQSFAGIYEFSLSGQYKRLFPLFLKQSADQGMIMCHPGHLAEAGDNIAKARFEEFQYFTSEQFLTDCSQQQAAIQRFSC